MQQELRPIWNKLFHFNWRFGLFLILIVCIPRFILVLHANASGNYSSIGLIMLISAIAPFVFLTKNGRRKIGLTKPINHSWLLISFVAGFMFSFLLYSVGQSLYGSSFENWYRYIGKSYNIPAGMNEHNKAILFAVFTLPGMTFSPIGEE